MIHKIINKLRSEGAVALLQTLGEKIYRPSIQSYRDYIPFFQNKRGLEIGGLSSIFMNGDLCPIYSIARSIDNCNFHSQTVWEGLIKSGQNFKYSPDRDYGNQYITEASQLSFALSESYDFLISSHMIEHTANPLKALVEWKRVLKAEGMMVLAIPHKDGTFDRYRPVTSIGHIVQDFEQQIDESDMTHLSEILKLHDFASDPLVGSLDEFTKRCEKNIENRCLHHHVFDTKLAIEIIDFTGLQIKSVSTARPYHIFIFAQKLDYWDNHKFLDNQAKHFNDSIFQSDKSVSV
jgi:SAM-dependent methyltransferase